MTGSKRILRFCVHLNNHAKSSTDIVTIMTRTVSGMDGPIKEIVSGFLVTAERYGNADLAFDFACESVDNRTLKTIFVNLKTVCTIRQIMKRY